MDFSTQFQIFPITYRFFFFNFEGFSETHLYSRDAFKVYDLNEDGLITKAELVQAMKLLGEDISEDYAEIVISKVDDDKDGKVNFEEFKNWMRDGIKDI